MNKKGISPLIATVVLIILAIGVGVIVMNWGRAELEVRSKCAVDTELKIVTLNNEPQICYSGSGDSGFIKFIVENGPNVDIGSLLFTSIGSKKPYNTELSGSSIEKGYTIQKTVPYNYNLFGDIKQVKITPKIIVYSAEPSLICTEQALVLENIKPC